MGDKNNAYFHAYFKSRGNNKSVQFLQWDDGSILTNHKDIETEFLSLYRNLMGTATQRTTHIDIYAMKRGKHLDKNQCNFLVSKVTTGEIKEALSGIGDLRSPWINGYGSKVFKVCWNIVNRDVTVAIGEFFSQGRIFRNFTRTSVPLIPKTNEAKHARD
ncbi:uncharacterized protein LOC131605303 [Vicia villosa]|uniref:uncharacterized protein LOC131605303 n=1 Tax=Vicia villosa TaxID=3911 RepID=UPI00273B246D|nr:uncharacterized protein LOC131605303 [Vicia villosa]